VGFIVHITQSGVMEDTHAIFQDFVLGDIDVLPSIEDTRSDVLHNGGGDLASGPVEDIGKMIL
jgi:hypothetical protein